MKQALRNTGIGGHQKTVGDTQVWLTPPEIISSLGEFDLDPCSPINRPWDTAKHHYTEVDNGLEQPWFGRVWHNPPYDQYVISKWLGKMAKHANGITLMFARTETKYFQNWVFPYAMSMLFIKGRLHFHRENGERAKTNSGAPSVLISYSEFDADAISDSGIEGKHVLVNAIPVITVTQSPDWRSVVSISLINLNNEASLSEIYKMVERVAPDKVAKNKHYKEKIRQKLQLHFKRTGRGQYSLFN